MKRLKPLLFFTILLCSANILAQNYKLKGRIVDSANKQAIEFVNVSLLKSDSSFISGVNTDNNGFFELNCVSGDYIISASCLGYENRSTNITHFAKDQTIADIVLSPSSIQLQDITVTAASVINKSDRKLITPSQEQVKSSTSGIDLLQKLQLARINIDMINNSISTVSKGAVQLRLNGVQVTSAEISALKPEDIVRIEYHDDPGVRYGNVEAVLDYITRRKTSGGNINTQLMNNLTDGLGFAEDNLSAKYNYKKSEFSVNTYYSYRKIDWVRENEETFRFPDKTITRKEIGQPTPFKQTTSNSALNYSLMDKDNYFLNATLRFNFNKLPNDYSDRRSQLFVTGNDVPMSILDHSTSKTNSPVMDLYFQKNLKNNQLLIFNVVGTYINSHSTRLYQEGRGEDIFTDIYSNISGDKYSLIAEGIYERKMGKGKLTGGMKHMQVYTENNYKGTTVANVSMKQAESNIYGEYQLKAGKFSYTANLKLSRFYYSQGTESNEQYSLQPSFRVSYNPSDNLYFRYRFDIFNNTPSLSYLNDVEQAIDSLQIRRGNPNLKSFTSYKNSINMGYSKGIFSVDFSSQYYYENKPIMESIYYQDGLFVRTYENQKSFTGFYNNLSLKISPLKDHLSISISPGWNYFKTRGLNYEHTYNCKYIRVGVQGSYKGFVGRFEYNSPSNWLYGEQVSGGESTYIISLGYVKPKWSLSLMAFSPFGGTYKREDKNYSDLNPVKSTIRTDNLVQECMISFTYNFDFGRKFQGGNKRTNNNDTDSGIMSGAK